MQQLVKRAVELKSIDQLNLCAWVRYYVRQKALPLTELVRIGRVYHATKLVDPDCTVQGEGWKSALAQALDEAGFIRHDFTPGMFGVNRLYAVVLHDTGLSALFPKTPAELNNERYETM